MTRKLSKQALESVTDVIFINMNLKNDKVTIFFLWLSINININL